METNTGLDSSTSETLACYFSERLGLPQPGSIVEWRTAGQGLSDETLFIALEDTRQRWNLVIRLYRSTGLLREETDISRHFRVLSALSQSGVPVPTALWYEPDSTILGAPFFVMTRVEGHVTVPWSSAGRTFLAEAGRGPIGRQFVEILARIHRLEWQNQFEFLPAPGSPREYAEQSVRRLVASIHTHKRAPEPILLDALGFLHANIPEAQLFALVHGDYRTGNLVYDGDRIAAVLDWEFAAVGDPIIDVAWVCARSNQMDSELVCFLLPRERFIREYEQASGICVDPEALHFWELYHQVRNTAMWLSSAASFAEGHTTDLRLARMAFTLPRMRRMVADMLGYT